MKTRRFGVRTILLGLFATVLTGLGLTAGAGVASACGEPQHRSAAFAGTLPQVRFGQSGTVVQGLQLNLKNRGYGLTGTGYYGTRTLAAVQDFQRRNGINPSGIVGSRTWQALVGSMSEAATTKSHRPDFSVHPGERDRFKVGIVRDHIGRIYGYWDFDFTWYDPELRRQVQRFQKANGIRASGIVGVKTWAAMTKVISISGGWGC